MLSLGKRITIYLMLCIAIVAQSPNIPGCLKVDPKTKLCLACDSQNGYIFNTHFRDQSDEDPDIEAEDVEDQCITDYVDGCWIMSQFGHCLVCHKKYYLHDHGHLCIELKNKVDNCYYHLGEGICGICDPGYMLNQYECDEISNAIDNCFYEVMGSNCLFCNDGYYPNPTHEACLPDANYDNCEYYSNVTCQECDSDYLLDLNYYLFRDYGRKSGINNLNHHHEVSILSGADELPRYYDINQCYPKDNIPNCDQFLGSEKCEKCSTGFYLKENRCWPNPNPPIADCFAYSEAGLCLECNQGCYLATNDCYNLADATDDCYKNDPRQNLCILITDDDLIEGCELYDGSATSVSCLKCVNNDTNYSTGTACTSTRSNTDAQCASYSWDEDKCSECNDGFDIYANGTVCAPDILDCVDQTYEGNPLGPVCNECGNHKKLNSNDCTTNNDDDVNCLTHDGTRCTGCDDDYYVDEASDGTWKCFSQDKGLPECLKYDDAFYNSCEECSLAYSLEIPDSHRTCAKVFEVAFCDTYSDIHTCSECQDGFNLISSSNSCDNFIYTPNCVREVDDICVKCEEGYTLLDDSLCRKLADPFLHCLDDDNKPVDQSRGYSCPACKEGYVPIDGDEIYYCNNERFSYFPFQHPNNECKMFFKNVAFKDDYTCLACNKNFYIEAQGYPYCQAEEIHENNADQTFVINFGFWISDEENGFKLKNLKGLTSVASRRLPSNVDHCELVSFASRTEFHFKNIACVKCKSYAIPMKGNSFKVALNSKEKVESGDYEYQDVGENSLSVECVDNSNHRIVDMDSFVEHCEYYRSVLDKLPLFTSSIAVCDKCKFGYQAVTYHDEIVGTFVIECKKMEECAPNRLTGLALDKNIARLWGFNLYEGFTCHICKDTNKIPFLHVDSAFKRTVYDINLDIPAEVDGDTVPGQYDVECRDPSSAAGLEMLNEGGPEKYVSFVKNCAFGVYTVDTPKLSEIGSFKSSAYCVACKPGYEPTYSDDQNLLIVECKPIEGCDNDNPLEGWPNLCKNCKANYTHESSIENDTTVVWDYLCTEKTSAPNCDFYLKELATLPDAPSTNNGDDSDICFICKEGYEISENGTCHPSKYADCETMRLSLYVATIQNGGRPRPGNDQAQYTNFDSNVFMKSMSYNLKGCNSCKNKDDFLIRNLVSWVGCKKPLPGYKIEDIYSDIGPIVSDCRIFEDDGTCRECKRGYIKKSDGTECVAANDAGNGANLANCKIFTDRNTCQTCKDGYTKSGAICYQHTVDNCKTYSATSGGIECNGCKDGYFLKHDKCHQGDDPHCLVYGTSGRFPDCITCKDGYMIYPGSEECREIPEAVGCLVYNPSLECTKCRDNTFLLPGSSADEREVKKWCVREDSIPHCKVINSSHECDVCKDNFFLDNKDHCTPRVFSKNVCDEYTIDADTCDSCSDGWYMDNNICRRNSDIGIAYCEEYTDKNICKYCKDKWYPKEGICIKLKDDEIIDDCLRYDEDKNCLKCDIGKYYNSASNTCIDGVPNCKKHLEGLKSFCVECDDGYVLGPATETTQNSCEVLVQIQNCLRQFDNELCQECAEMHFVDIDGKCNNASHNVDNCKEMNDETTCKKCKPGYVLSTEGFACIDYFADSNNCVDLQEQSKPRCIQCMKGHFIDNFLCQECPNGSYGSGCAYCNPYNTSECLICRPGFNMKIDLTCEVNTDIDISGLIDEDRAFDDEPDFVPRKAKTSNGVSGSQITSASVLSTLVLVIGILIFIN